MQGGSPTPRIDTAQLCVEKGGTLVLNETAAPAKFQPGAPPSERACRRAHAELDMLTWVPGVPSLWCCGGKRVHCGYGGWRGVRAVRRLAHCLPSTRRSHEDRGVPALEAGTLAGAAWRGAVRAWCLKKSTFYIPAAPPSRHELLAYAYPGRGGWFGWGAGWRARSCSLRAPVRQAAPA